MRRRRDGGTQATLTGRLALWLLAILALLPQCAVAGSRAQPPTPQDVWRDFDPDRGDFREEIVRQETVNGVFCRESYISAYVLGEEIRVYCKYGVKEGARNAPGLMNVHGWMSTANVDQGFIRDGWAVMAHDYCGKRAGRRHYTRYPEGLNHGNMEARSIHSRTPDGKDITDPRQTSHYLWYALQRRALSYLLAQKEVDGTRVGAKGFSYGGTLMWDLGMDPRVKAIVAYFGIGWLEYYRNRRVWMYDRPYREPERSPGEELYLATVSPQAHAPYITAASLWLNGTNDHHGGHERGEQTFRMFRPGVPWSFAHQPRGHHNTEGIGQDCKLWLEKHVLGRDIPWPQRPGSEIRLAPDGVPELHVTPDAPDTVEELKVYYAVKSPISFARSWRDTQTFRRGDTWVGKMPVMNVDDYVFGFANIRYESTIVLSSDFTAAVPSSLGDAVATDQPSNVISEGTGAWTNVAPVEGIGGVRGFRVLDSRRGTMSEQFVDPKWKAPEGAQLSFRFYCTQPQTITIAANRHYRADMEITASHDWQLMTVRAESMMNVHSGQPMTDWSNTESVQITPKAGSDITKVIFAQFEWVVPERREPEPDEDGRAYLTREMASTSESFWRVMNNRSVSGKAISVGRERYERGLGVHAESEITFPLDGKYESFHVVPGPDDAHHGVLEMKILVDGTEVFASGRTRSIDNKPRAPLDIPVDGARALTLIVTTADGDRGGDHASWADAYLLKRRGPRKGGKESTVGGHHAGRAAATARESLPPLAGGRAPQNLEELWGGYDPTMEPVGVEIVKEWRRDGVVLRAIRYEIGTFRGEKAWMGAIYGFPVGARKLPALIHCHGGGQFADANQIVCNAKRGYAGLSINWGEKPMTDSYKRVVEKPNTDWGAIHPSHAVCPRKTPSALCHNDLRRGPFRAMLVYMGKRVLILGSAFNMIGGLIGVLGWLLRFTWLMLVSKAALAARLLALQSQLVTCTDAIEQKKAPKPKFTLSFRLLWIVLSKWLPDWRKLAHVMQPATVVRWHRRMARFLWRWKSRPGRPPVSPKMQALIRRLSRENPLWGAEHIREELAKLKYDPPCEDSVRKYMVRPGKPRKPSGTWLPFLRNHLEVAWAMDFFTVKTLTFRTLHVFVILEHGRRKVRHWAVTTNPTTQWAIQQLREAMAWGEQPRFMHRDNDGIYGDGVPEFLEHCGIEQVPTALHSPWQNPFVERFIGTLRRELLDHVIPLSQSHLERLLREFIEDYYHVERPHQGLGGETPVPHEAPAVSGPTRLVSTPVLGGLHHTYRRVAA